MQGGQEVIQRRDVEAAPDLVDVDVLVQRIEHLDDRYRTAVRLPVR